MSSEYDKVETERLRQDLLSTRRELTRMLETHQLEKARMEAELATLRSSSETLQATVDSLVMQRNKESRQRSEQAKSNDELRTENSKLRREVAAALDSRASHLRVPQVSFEQYKELLTVLESYQRCLLGGSGGGSGAVDTSSASDASAAAVANARSWVNRMQSAPFVNKDDAPPAQQQPSSSILRPSQLEQGAAPSSAATYSSPSVAQKSQSSPTRSPGPHVPIAAAATSRAPSLAQSTVVRENIVEGGRLVKLTTEVLMPGSAVPTKQWSVHNTTNDTQFIVEYTFGPLSRIEPLGDTAVEGSTYRLNLYPNETKPFISGTVNGYKMSVRYGPPDEGYLPPSCPTDVELVPMSDRVRTIWRRSPQGVDVSDIASLCHTEGIPFVDVDFPPLSVSIARTFELLQDETPPTLYWLAPSKFLPKGTAPELCRSAVLPTAITAGVDLDDGWLVSAMAALAEDADMIGHMFSPTSSNDEREGLFSVWMNKHGLWNIVHVDGFLPCKDTRNTSGQIAGSRQYALHGAHSVPEPNDMWPAVLEKVTAKCHGSYFSLRHGDVLEALQDFTGFPVERFDWARDKDVAVFPAIHRVLSTTVAHSLGTDSNNNKQQQQLINQNIVMLATATTAEADSKLIRGLGFRPQCAYRVLASVFVDQLRLVLIRVSLRSEAGRWTGDWSESSDLWSRYPNARRACVAAAAAIDDASGSCIWMEWRDVTRYFGGCGVCYCRLPWLDIRIPNRFLKTKPSFMIEVSCLHQATRVFVGVHQKDRRGLPNTDPDHLYGAFLISVVACGPNQTWDVVGQSHNGTFWRGRDAFLDINFEPCAKPYYIIPRRYSAEGIKDVVVSLHIEHREAISSMALKEVSDDVLNSLRYNPIHKFDVSGCNPISRFECQIDREAKTQLEW